MRKQFVTVLCIILIAGIFLATVAILGNTSPTGYNVVDSLLRAIRGPPSCTAGYKCYSTTVLGYQNKKCRWSNLQACQYGCLNNACYFNTTCQDKFSCSGNTLVHQLTDCTNITQNCPFGCSNNACNPDPCAGIICPDVCKDVNNLNTGGNCVAGGCQYTPVPCNYGCANNACKSNPCAGITCPNICQDSTTLKINGQCVSGVCQYSNQTCPYGCANGACNNPPSSGTTYYVDSVAGNDANAGTSESLAWQTLTKVSSASLAPGDSLLLKRGSVWTGTLTVSRSGTAAQNILIGAYGSGELPLIQNSAQNGVSLTGSYLTVENIATKAIATTLEAGCSNNPTGFILGFDLGAGSHSNILRYVQATGGYAGVFIRSGSYSNQVLHSTFQNNNMMHPLDTAGNNDAGAFGVLLWGDDNEIAYNEFTGQDACSYDYVRDGSAVEIYGGQRNYIHHNTAINNNQFTELGNPRSSDNTYVYNLVTSSLTNSGFLTTRGNGSSYGPIFNTKAYHNTAYLTGSSSQGFVCHAGCTPSILSLKNNIIWAELKAGYADASFDESNNIFWSTDGMPLLQFTKSSASLVANPLFISTSNFHLQSSSPARDSGIDLGYASDLDGNVVPQNGIPDMGAYEYSSNITPQCTLDSQCGSASCNGSSSIKPKCSSSGVCTTQNTPCSYGCANGACNNPPSSSFRFVSWGDTKSGTAGLAVLSNQAVLLNPVFTIYGGDLENSGFTLTGMNAWKAAINGNSNNGMFDITLPSRGNHDNEQANSVANWQAYYNMASTVARIGGSNYNYLVDDITYSFDYGNSHFVALDVLGDVNTMSSAQITWLDSDLTAAESRGLVHAFLYWHGPIYPGAEHCCAVPPTSLVTVLNKHPLVSATFHGHEHSLYYEHIDGTRITGITHPFEEFVTANAGVDHTYPMSRPVDWSMTLNCPTVSGYCSPPIHGFATIDVSGTSFTVTAYKKGITTPQNSWTFTK